MPVIFKSQIAKLFTLKNYIYISLMYERHNCFLYESFIKDHNSSLIETKDYGNHFLFADKPSVSS